MMQTTAELMQQGQRVCAGCNGQMRVAGGLVGCDVCGTTDETHPLTVASRAARGERFDVEARRVVPAPVSRDAVRAAAPAPVRLEEMAGGHAERIMALERSLRDALARIVMLEQGVAAARRPKAG